jgi:hypothetical protein
MIRYTLEEVKKARRITSWWIVLLDPFASRVGWCIANFTNLRPNTITILGGTIAFTSAVLMFNNYLIIGAILFEIFYIFDMVDGRIARLKDLSSKGGKCLDYLMDRVVIFSLTLALVLNSLNTPPFTGIVFLGFIFAFLEIFNILASNTINQTFDIKSDLLSSEDAGRITKTSILLKKYRSIKEYMDRFRLPVLPSGIEAIHIAFFIGPITGEIFWCFLLGILILLFELIITIFLIKFNT